MKTHLSASSLIGNGAALVGLALGGAFAGDWLGRKLGYQPGLICGMQETVSVLAATGGVVIGAVGAVIWVLSGLRDAAGLALLAGAVLLGVLPGVLLQYLGRIAEVTCGQAS